MRNRAPLSRSTNGTSDGDHAEVDGDQRESGVRGGEVELEVSPRLWSSVETRSPATRPAARRPAASRTLRSRSPAYVRSVSPHLQSRPARVDVGGEVGVAEDPTDRRPGMWSRGACRRCAGDRPRSDLAAGEGTQRGLHPDLVQRTHARRSHPAVEEALHLVAGPRPRYRSGRWSRSAHR